MICPKGFETAHISAYIEGDLHIEQMRGLEEHLPGCSACRNRLVQLEALLEAASSFTGTEPGRDLWPSIESRLTERTGSSPLQDPPKIATRASGWRNAPYQTIALAASVVLVLVSAVLFTRSSIEERIDPDPVTDPFGALSVLDSEFSASLDSLDTTFQQLVSQIQPGDSAIASMVLEVLKTLDEVIEDARRDLLDNPGDPLRHGYYTRSVRRKAEALRKGLALMGQV